MAISGHRRKKNFYNYIKAEDMEYIRMMKRLILEIV
jgi:hypothetical protein